MYQIHGKGHISATESSTFADQNLSKDGSCSNNYWDNGEFVGIYDSNLKPIKEYKLIIDISDSLRN